MWNQLAPLSVSDEVQVSISKSLNYTFTHHLSRETNQSFNGNLSSRAKVQPFNLPTDSQTWEVKMMKIWEYMPDMES